MLDAHFTRRQSLGRSIKSSIELSNSQGRPALLSAASMALLKGADRAQEIDPTKLRPEHIREVEFAVRALPQQETGEPDLAARSDDQVGIGQVGGIEIGPIASGVTSAIACSNVFPATSCSRNNDWIASVISRCPP